MKHFYLLFFAAFLFRAGALFGQGFNYTPPENFVADSSNLEAVTWFNKSAGSVIQISVTPESSYYQFSKSFSDGQLTDQSLIIKEKRVIKICDSNKKPQESLLFICSYMAASEDVPTPVEFTRIVCFTGDDSKVIMAVATIPALAESVLLEPLIDSFIKNLIIL